jgi:hypothetical protein
MRSSGVIFAEFGTYRTLSSSSEGPEFKDAGLHRGRLESSGRRGNRLIPDDSFVAPKQSRAVRRAGDDVIEGAPLPRKAGPALREPLPRGRSRFRTGSRQSVGSSPLRQRAGAGLLAYLTRWPITSGGVLTFGATG